MLWSYLALTISSLCIRRLSFFYMLLWNLHSISGYSSTLRTAPVCRREAVWKILSKFFVRKEVLPTGQSFSVVLFCML